MNRTLQSTAMEQRTVDIALPVLNEEHVLERSVATLDDYLARHSPYPWRITIADNGSTDGTWEIALLLAVACEHIHALRIDRRGRGLALRTAWSQSDADIVAYMDIDLSTGLEAFLPLIAPLAAGQCHIATGSRLRPDAEVTRGVKREVVSRCYNALAHMICPHRFSDAQCGFKALTRAAAQELLPLVENNHWFFDTELLLMAEERGYDVHEVPVRWVEDTDSRVHIVRTAKEDIAGLLRVRDRRWQRRFGHERRPMTAPARDRPASAHRHG